MIYLDNASTTRVDDAVLQAMLPYLQDKYGNASSTTHAFGWVADEAVRLAAERIAASWQVDPAELVFTSGATESINLALKGVYHRYGTKGRHIITQQTEHKAVLDTCAHLEKLGAEITYLAVDNNGRIDTGQLARAIRADTILVSIMAVNNETGVIQPVREIADICRAGKTLYFCDATQAPGKIKFMPAADGISMVACSAHKLHGPKGIGILWISSQRPAARLQPLIDGGSQQNGLRAGTLNVPAIVGMGKAFELAQTGELTADMRDLLEQLLRAELPELSIQGATSERAPHISNIVFPGIDASRLISAVQPEMAISTGSACTSGDHDPSHVLMAMGLPEREARAVIRLSVSKYTTVDEIRKVVSVLADKYRTLRS